MLHLNPNISQSLELSLCDTFAPKIKGIPSATKGDVAHLAVLTTQHCQVC